MAVSALNDIKFVLCSGTWSWSHDDECTVKFNEDSTCEDNHAPILHTALSDAAFKQKMYRLRLQKGSVKVKNRTTYGLNSTYEYRLLWDKSPFTPLEEWNAKAAAQAGRYWERKDFYKEQIKDAE